MKGAYVNAKEFAEKTGLPLDTVKRWCREKRIPNILLGRRYCIPLRAALEKVNTLMGMPAQPKKPRNVDYDALFAAVVK